MVRTLKCEEFLWVNQRTLVTHAKWMIPTVEQCVMVMWYLTSLEYSKMTCEHKLFTVKRLYFVGYIFRELVCKMWFVKVIFAILGVSIRGMTRTTDFRWNKFRDWNENREIREIYSPRNISALRYVQIILSYPNSLKLLARCGNILVWCELKPAATSHVLC